MPLTDAKCRSALARGRPYKMSDGGGLYLLVNTQGGRYWRMDYRFLGKRKTLAFGVYPSTSLAEARHRRDAAKALLAKDVDPGRERKLARREAMISASQTFKVVADEYIAKLEREGRAAVTIDKKRWLIDLVDHEIGSLPIADVRAPASWRRCIASRLAVAMRPPRVLARWSAPSHATPSPPDVPNWIQRQHCVAH